MSVLRAGAEVFCSAKGGDGKFSQAGDVGDCSMNAASPAKARPGLLVSRCSTRCIMSSRLPVTAEGGCVLE